MAETTSPGAAPWRERFWRGLGAAVLLTLLVSTASLAEAQAPVSTFLSPLARDYARQALAETPTGLTTFEAARAFVAVRQAKITRRWLAIYPCRIRTAALGGVRVDLVTPESGVARRNRRRVLISLHGGGFLTGGGDGARSEAVPLAGRGRVLVVAVDYRMAPGNVFPAASEDVAAVYRALLKSHRPDEIGIYGCSAGGTLAAEAVAWFQTTGLTRPGAVGIFCSGALPGFWYGGDSGAAAALFQGPPPPAFADPPRSYFTGANPNDPLVTPATSAGVIARFPPTLFVTGSRDVAMSNALATRMIFDEAGVETGLVVQEGMGHGDFVTFAGSPESAYVYDAIWRFFDAKLGL